MRKLVLATTIPLTPESALEAICNSTDALYVNIQDGESVELLKDRLRAIHWLALDALQKVKT
jgi:hypothetical protein